MKSIELIKTEVRGLSPYKVDEISAPVKLDANENPYPLPVRIQSEITQLLSEIPLNRYPDPHASELRREISRWLSIPEEMLMVGNGSDELIQGVLIATSGDSPVTVIPVPTFSMYRITGIVTGHRVVEVPLDENFDLSAAALIEACRRERAKVIFLSTPNNPTGNSFSEERVLEVIRESNSIVVVDEAYGDFSGRSFIPHLQGNPNLIVLKTLSKIGMAGLRLGIMCANSELISEIDKVRLPYNINSLSQAAASVVLRNMETINEQVDMIVHEREVVFEGLRKMEGVTPFRSDANFILFKVPDADRLHLDLVAKGVLIRNLNRPGRLENCMRVTIGTHDENHAFLAAMNKLLREMAKS